VFFPLVKQAPPPTTGRCGPPAPPAWPHIGRVDPSLITDAPLMLRQWFLYRGKGFGGHLWWMGGVEDFTGDVALEATHRLVLALALGEAPGHVVAGGLLATQPDHQDDMQSSVGVTVTPAVESVPNGFPLEACSGQTPAELGECARTAPAGATPPTRRCPAGRMDSLRPGGPKSPGRGSAADTGLC
jgi:hypothetical protein